MENPTLNQKALLLLEEAACTSSLVKEKDRKNREVKIEHIYPVTREETLKMARLLDQAFKAADDPEDPGFRDRYDQLMDIVQWSNTKHRTWNWALIGGVAIVAAIFFLGAYSQKDDIEKHKGMFKTIKAWTPSDTTITWEECKVGAVGDTNYYKSAVNWKSYQLAEDKRFYTEAAKSAEDYRHRLDTATTKENKKSYEHWIQHYDERAAEMRSRFDDLAHRDFKGVQKHAEDRVKKWLKSDRSTRNFAAIMMLFFLALIGLYIWTGYPYGYELTRTRTRDKILTWIRKAGFWLAGITFGAGLAAQLFAEDKTVEYIYSSGRRETRRESDIAGTAMNVMWKIALMFIGVVIFVSVSVLVMTIEALGGLPEKFRELKAS